MRASDSRLHSVRLATAVAAMATAPLALGAGDLLAQETSAADSAAVVEVIERYHTALAEADTAAVMALLAPNAIILESGGMETREEYRSHHLPADMAFARAVPRERGDMHVRVHGFTAWAASLNTARGTYRDREIDSRGAELMVFHRTETGWLIDAIHWSSR
jgi:ketosteroid isomerase-like protein